MKSSSKVSRILIATSLASAMCLAACQVASADQQPSVKKSPTVAPAVSPSSLRLEVGRAGLEDTSFVQIFGEVFNETGQPIENVVVHVELLDKDGKPLDVGGWHREIMHEELARGEVQWVPAGASTPFHYIRDASKIKGTYASHRLTVTARPARSASMPLAAVEGITTTPRDFDQVDLKGTLRVTGTAPCRSPEAMFGFYVDGKLVDIVSPHKSALEPYFQKDLAAGQSIAFEGKSFPRGGGKSPSTKVKAWGVCAD